MSDTIVAPASGLARAGVGVIRVSGPDVKNIAIQLAGKLPQPRYAEYVSFQDIDKGLMLYFPSPRSFTGEDVLEIHCHGSPIIINLIIKKIIELGARLARPGEFSERAFLNGKIDLTQAEAIADMINAGSEAAARAALHSLEGVFSEKIHALDQSIIELRMYVEAALDFPEEEVDFLQDGVVQKKFENIKQTLAEVLLQAKQGVILQTGMTVVIAGKPNAGKSSLLNLLSGRDSAIVTPISGTTRDILRENIDIDGMPLQIIDTAGLRETDDPVEQEGVRRAQAMIEKADRVLYLKDVTHDEHESDDLLQHKALTIIYNKIDLIKKQASLEENKIYLSVKTGEGIDLLKNHLKTCMGFSESTENACTARERHVDALKRAEEYLEKADVSQGELLAENLGLAHKALGEIVGVFSTEDLLGKIFSTFCIGK